MSEVIDKAPQEFWRPPIAQPEPAVPSLVEVCDRCATEFMVGAKFCHDCGAARRPIASPFAERSWMRALEFLR